MGCHCQQNALVGSLLDSVVALVWQVLVISNVTLGPVEEILQKQYHQDQDGQPYHTILERERQG